MVSNVLDSLLAAGRKFVPNGRSGKPRCTEPPKTAKTAPYFIFRSGTDLMSLLILFLFLFLFGRPSLKKLKAPSFQMGSGWNLQANKRQLTESDFRFGFIISRCRPVYFRLLCFLYFFFVSVCVFYHNYESSVQWRRSVINLGGGSRPEATSLPPSILLSSLPSRGLPTLQGVWPELPHPLPNIWCNLCSETAL